MIHCVTNHFSIIRETGSKALSAMTAKTDNSPKPAHLPRIRRVPTGTVSAKPIALRLMPDELQQIKEISRREQRSMAAVCRLAMLRGLADYQQAGLID